MWRTPSSSSSSSNSMYHTQNPNYTTASNASPSRPEVLLDSPSIALTQQQQQLHSTAPIGPAAVLQLLQPPAPNIAAGPRTAQIVNTAVRNQNIQGLSSERHERFTGMTPPVQYALQRHLEYIVNAEFKRTVLQAANPYLEFADLLLAASTYSTDRNEFVYSVDFFNDDVELDPVTGKELPSKKDLDLRNRGNSLDPIDEEDAGGAAAANLPNAAEFSLADIEKLTKGLSDATSDWNKIAWLFTTDTWMKMGDDFEPFLQNLYTIQNRLSSIINSVSGAIGQTFTNILNGIKNTIIIGPLATITGFGLGMVKNLVAFFAKSTWMLLKAAGTKIKAATLAQFQSSLVGHRVTQAKLGTMLIGGHVSDAHRASDLENMTDSFSNYIDAVFDDETSMCCRIINTFTMQMVTASFNIIMAKQCSEQGETPKVPISKEAKELPDVGTFEQTLVTTLFTGFQQEHQEKPKPFAFQSQAMTVGADLTPTNITSWMVRKLKQRNNTYKTEKYLKQIGVISPFFEIMNKIKKLVDESDEIARLDSYKLHPIRRFMRGLLVAIPKNIQALKTQYIIDIGRYDYSMFVVTDNKPPDTQKSEIWLANVDSPPKDAVQESLDNSDTRYKSPRGKRLLKIYTRIVSSADAITTKMKNYDMIANSIREQLRTIGNGTTKDPKVDPPKVDTKIIAGLWKTMTEADEKMLSMNTELEKLKKRCVRLENEFKNSKDDCKDLLDMVLGKVQKGGTTVGIEGREKQLITENARRINELNAIVAMKEENVPKMEKEYTAYLSRGDPKDTPADIDKLKKYRKKLLDEMDTHEQRIKDKLTEMWKEEYRTQFKKQAANRAANIQLNIPNMETYVNTQIQKETDLKIRLNSIEMGFQLLRTIAMIGELVRITDVKKTSDDLEKDIKDKPDLIYGVLVAYIEVLQVLDACDNNFLFTVVADISMPEIEDTISEVENRLLNEYKDFDEDTTSLYETIAASRKQQNDTDMMDWAGTLKGQFKDGFFLYDPTKDVRYDTLMSNAAVSTLQLNFHAVVSRPKIKACMQMATDEINLMSRTNQPKFTTHLLVISPYINTNYAKFVIFIYEGRSITNPVKVARGLAPYAVNNNVQVRANTGGRTRFNMAEDGQFMEGVINFFSNVQFDPYQDLLVYVENSSRQPPTPWQQSRMAGNAIIQQQVAQQLQRNNIMTSSYIPTGSNKRQRVTNHF